MKQIFEVWNYKFLAKGDDEADVYLDGDIVDAGTEALYKEFFGDDSSVSYRTFRNQVLEKNPKTLNVYINSYGGMVYDAFAMHDFLVEQRSKGVKVNTKVRGIAASAATLVALSGDNVEMSENSVFMIHNVSSGVWGDVNTIERVAKAMRKLNDQIVSLYTKRTSLTAAEIGDMMNEETHLTAAEAKEKGFIDQVTGAVDFKNTIKPEQWAFKDQSILNFFNKQVKNTDMTGEQIKAAITNTVTEVLKNLGITKPENKEEIDTDAIVGQVTDKLKPVFENRITELEGQVSTEKTAKEAAEAKVTGLENKISEQNKKIAKLQGAEGGAAPTDDPTPDGADKMTDEQKEDFKFENDSRALMGIDPISEEAFMNSIKKKASK